MKNLNKATLALCIQAAIFAPQALAQEDAETKKAEAATLEKITVTARKRTQSIQDVPMSISTLNGEKFEAIFSAGDDILALATRVPGLYAESSNGRVAPRFYMRGLGNTDFDLAASQPVSIVMDEVVKENVILKSFPLFDVAQVEVLRGPQGTLFGRNTTAGMVKFDTNKPTQDFEAFTELSVGNLGTVNFEGAISGELAEDLSGRFSVLSQNRGDWIDNAYTGENDAMGGFNERAWRGQLMYSPSADASMLLSVWGRDLDGTSSIFRANTLTQGSNDFNQHYDRDRVYYNNGDNNPQSYKNIGMSLKSELDLNSGHTFTSITSFETAEGRSLGDIDGGVALFVPEDIDGDGDVETSFPGFIPFDAVTEDQLDDLYQMTQEFRLASDTNEALTWQAGVFYYDSGFNVTTLDGFFGATTVYHQNTTWAVFGQATYDVNEQLNITGGLRYTDDKKSLRVGLQNVDGFARILGIAAIQDYDDIHVDDSQVSYELTANYKVDVDTSVYARLANGFRAPTIQGRDVAFEGNPSVAKSETVTSIEFGFKSDMLDDTLRLNGAVYYYQIDDMQFSAIGGEGNFTTLINADKGIGTGFEVEAQWLASENLVFTAGYSLNDTEIDDANLRVAPCGSGQCTVLDPVDGNGNAIVDGNPFPQAPESTLSLTGRYSMPMGDDGEIYVYSDLAVQGETNLFLYESAEYRTDNNFELGLRLGYENFSHDYSVSFFVRNLTDEENLRGGIDFNNLTTIDNQPRMYGIEFRKNFF